MANPESRLLDVGIFPTHNDALTRAENYVIKRFLFTFAECLVDLATVVIYAICAGLLIGAIIISDAGWSGFPAAIAWVLVLPILVIAIIVVDAFVHVLVEVRRVRFRDAERTRTRAF